MSLQRYFKNRERQRFFSIINSSLFESKNVKDEIEEKVNEDAPSTSKNEDAERSFQPESSLCIFLEATDGIWSECDRVAVKPLTQKLQEIVLRRNLLFAVNAQRIFTPRVCNHHWRLIWLSEASSMENLSQNQCPEEQEHEEVVNIQNGNEEPSIELQLQNEEATLKALDFELNDKKRKRKYKRKNGELDDSDSDNDQPGHSKLSRIASRHLVESLIEYSKNTITASEEVGHCNECSYNPEAPCNVTRSLTFDQDITKTLAVEEKRNTELRQRLVEISTRQEPIDAEEDDDHVLSILSAAALRRYRKHFEIPTKPSATKHAMLEGVISHFESMPANAGEAIAHFIAATSQSEKRPQPSFSVSALNSFNRSRRFQ
ncbi:unnamed protein product, partial [Mesorhabditis belari]|uniref:Histone deacetylase complex subunit SAP30 Sin3 binding domain-containing protein n=1 Tax=Mesorhabditis belari TaxID=2138241 RepID=A0AAF3EAT9_9BILA